ncbi:aminoglycoside 6-adenylyltransferase [Micromonospora soli]|uniref:aminoglycoside 6-adenylyltransferase n=1 Tax=Micromonospora sp. NBRC 110009 TaxID=3061627 RepID=UPI002671BD27|nr:aminoglycoside 6-adenylyltransferase [Micromonospora sp. NBRC 110009]WKT99277.1 aminoglycoside 6-adenylyltransferase [Micromonospora sp. NBRC 110009]
MLAAIVDAAVVDNIESLLAAIAMWAQQRHDIRAALVVGSHARADVPADQWSDIDIVIVVDDPTTYATDGSWLTTFGRPLLTFTEPTAVGGFIERRVLFDTGQDVDFALLPSAAVEQIGTDPEAATVWGRGFRVLVDKVNLERRLPGGAAPVRPAPPDTAVFGHLTHDFWYHALWTAKKLRRGEVWIAKECCDCYLKTLLVRLLAWHAQASRPVDTWHGGRFLERWADRQALHDLRSAYASYDADDVARALWATVDLFGRLERKCADRLGLELTVPHDEIRKHLHAVLP